MADTIPCLLIAHPYRWVDLAGGADDVLAAAVLAVDNEEYQWGLQLTSLIEESGRGGSRNKELRGICLRSLANREVSAPGMNW